MILKEHPYCNVVIFLFLIKSTHVSFHNLSFQGGSRERNKKESFKVGRTNAQILTKGNVLRVDTEQYVI